jgi:hypothetical protein
LECVLPAFDAQPDVQLDDQPDDQRITFCQPYPMNLEAAQVVVSRSFSFKNALWERILYVSVL